MGYAINKSAHFLWGYLLINSPRSRLCYVCWCVERVLSHLVLFVSLQAPAIQDTADSLVDDFVVTESASAVEVAIAESAAAVQPVRTARLSCHTAVVKIK